MPESSFTLYRGQILNPKSETDCDFYSDGGLLTGSDSALSVGDFDSIARLHPSIKVVQLPADQVMSPGFVDSHVHFPQNHVKGSFDGELLPWLRDHIWPEEAKFADEDFATRMAGRFVTEMTMRGTTAALVMSSIHRQAFEALMAYRSQLEMIAGNVLMDRNSPEELLQETGEAMELMRDLVIRFESQYAVTPRFAPTCSPELMRRGAEIAKAVSIPVHSHLAENRDEIAWVLELFPDHASYTQVYEDMGLLGPKTVMAHGIHLSDEELEILKKTGTTIAHCPTSNEALKSGRMPVERLRRAGIPFALGSDVGAGPSLSMLHVMQTYIAQHEAEGIEVTPEDALYRATLAGAQALGKHEKTLHRYGNFDHARLANVVMLKAHAGLRDAREAIEAILEGDMKTLEGRVMRTIHRSQERFKRA